jgi:hypothetical protein
MDRGGYPHIIRGCCVVRYGFWEKHERAHTGDHITPAATLSIGTLTKDA